MFSVQSTSQTEGNQSNNSHPLMLLEQTNCWTNFFVTIFWLHRTARSSTAMFIDLLLACYLANAACAIINVMTALIFIIVSRPHAFFLVVPVRSFLHALVAVAAILYFQHTPAVRSNDTCFNFLGWSAVILTWQWFPSPMKSGWFALCMIKCKRDWAHLVKPFTRHAYWDNRLW